ncbi:hypothetical protein, partial [Corynebacterium casei]
LFQSQLVPKSDHDLNFYPYNVGMEIVIVKSVSGYGYLCPNCGATVKYIQGRKRLSLHNLPSHPGKKCPATKMTAELQLDPNASITEFPNLLERPLVKEQPKQAKKQRRRRTVEGRDPRRRRTHWRDEYAIKGEDSWGIDDLGEEGGEISVRARSGGKVESRRTKY